MSLRKLVLNQVLAFFTFFFLIIHFRHMVFVKITHADYLNALIQVHIS